MKPSQTSGRPKSPASGRPRSASVPKSHPSSLVRLVIPAVIFVLTVLAYLPVLQNGFVNWDDESFLVNNFNYRGVGWQQIRWMFTTCYLSSCMPLTWVTYGLDYVFWGMNPRGYHLTSLLIHATNAVLFYFVSLRLLRLSMASSTVSWQLPIRLAAGSAALFFALHPLQVEVVAWTIGREMAVAGFFFFLTLLCYLKAAQNESQGVPRWRWMGAAWAFYAMSLLGKEVGMTLPFALIALDVYPLRRLGGGKGRWFGPQVRRVWGEKVPFLLLTLTAGVRAVLGKEGTGAVYHLAGYGLLPRVVQVLYSLAFYPWKTLVPLELSPLYPLHPFSGIWQPQWLLSGAFVFLLTAGFFFARRRWPGALAAWVFYAVLLLPVSGVVSFGPQLVADRFSYLPSLGWAVLLGAGLFYCWQLWLDTHVGLRTLVLTQSLAALLLFGFGVLTWQQTRIWQNSERLWRHALALDERSSFAHNNLALALAQRGGLEEAINHLRRAVEIDPAFVEARTNLGNFLALDGSPDAAIAHLREALKIDPAFANAHNTLGNILIGRGETDQAIEHFRKALETNPKSAITYYNLGRALARRGDATGAIENYRKALELNPDDPDVHNNLGLVFQSQRKFPEAVDHFQNALRIDPRYARAYFNLGRIFAGQGRLDDAVESLRRALQLQPRAAEIHEQLARVLVQQGKKAEALEHYQEALKLVKLRREQTDTTN
jgi:tetratricopeptide (TPR) repeat protein